MNARNAPSRVTTAEMLERLAAFDTTSRNSNLALIGFVREYLDAHGVPYRISTDATGEKANIHAIIGPHTGRRPRAVRPCRYRPGGWPGWSADPFTLRRAESAGCTRAAPAT